MSGNHNNSAPSNHFLVQVFVVDDTYWDDGNRTTARRHEFDTLKEAIEFRDRLLKKGYTTRSCVTDKEFTKHVDADSIQLYRWNHKKLPKSGWELIKNVDVVTLLGALATE